MTATAASAPLPLSKVLSHILVPLLMTIVMGLCYFAGFHHPDPHGLRVEVVGPTAEAGAIAASLEERLGEKLEVTTVPDEATAAAHLKERRITAAFVPSPTAPKLLTASAGSEAATNVAVKVFTAVAGKQGKPLAIDDIVPLTENDSAGQNAFFALVVMSIGAYATAIAIAAAGASRRFVERLGLAIGAGIAIPLIVLGIATILFDMFAGHGLSVLAISIAFCTTVSCITVGLYTLVGRFGTLLFNALFVALSFTSSGGVFPPELQPGFFSWLNSFWIGGGFIDLLQHVVYFPEASIEKPVWIFIGWGIAALMSLAVAFGVERRRRGRAELEHRAATLHRMLEQRRDAAVLNRESELELQEDFAV